MHIVLGAPGPGKSTVIALVASQLPQWVVLDWDALMKPAGLLAGADIPSTPSTWTTYAALVRTMVESVGPDRVVLFGVQTPDEMVDWPEATWTLLDCADDERQRRLEKRGEYAPGIVEAIEDAATYRRLGIFTIDGTTLTPAQVARNVIERVQSLG